MFSVAALVNHLHRIHVLKTPILQKNKTGVNSFNAEKRRLKKEKKRAEERRILRRRSHFVPETLNNEKEKELRSTARKGGTHQQ